MKMYFVDIPNKDSEFWHQIKQCSTKEEAIKFAKERFGADENGMISLVSEVDTEKKGRKLEAA